MCAIYSRHKIVYNFTFALEFAKRQGEFVFSLECKSFSFLSNKFFIKTVAQERLNARLTMSLFFQKTVKSFRKTYH